MVTPYQNGALGLKMNLPDGAAVVGASTMPPFCIISSGDTSNVWHIRLERGTNANVKTPRELLSMPKNTESEQIPAEILESRAMQVGDVQGWWRVERSSDESGVTILGRLAIPAHGEQFILASARTSDHGWSRNSGMLIQTLQSIVPVDPLLLIQNKLNGLSAATAQLTMLNKSSLQPLIGFKEWRRIQTSGTNNSPGADIGYALIQIESGNIDEVELQTGQEQMEPNGIIVSVTSRLVPNPNTGVVIDSYARYWMSWDGKEERWSNRVTRWMEKARATECETGLRNRPEIGSPKSRLMVVQQDLTADIIETPFKSLAEDPWLPRALVWVLGPFLSTIDEDSHFIWKAYENSGGLQRVVTRTDRLEKQPDGTRVIATHFGEENDSLWTTIDPQGRIILQEQRGGAFVTGTTQETLRAIWGPRNLW